MKKTDDFESIAFGRTLEFMTPSGRVFTIREQNGNDDDVLSNPVTGSDLTNIDNFLTGIMLNEKVGDKTIPVTFDMVVKLPNNDRYFILIQSRIHSIGPIIKFEYAFDESGSYNYEEDLSQYLHDYNKPFPEPGESDYFPYKIPPYPANATGESKYEVITKSGKVIRFGIMTRQGEKILLALTDEQRTRNSELKARHFEMQNETGWVKVDNFSVFSKMDMVEINKAVREVDPIYQFVSEIRNPSTGQSVLYNLITSTNFFYPVEV